MHWPRYAYRLLVISLLEVASTMTVREISAAVTVNGASFEIRAPSSWAVPKPGSETPVRLDLVLKNVSAGELRFYGCSAAEILLFGPDGKQIIAFGGRNGFARGPSPSPPVQPGESIVIECLWKLLWEEPAHRLVLRGGNELGDYWQFAPLQPGAYSVQAQYYIGNSANQPDDMIWTGRILSQPLLVAVE
jgi:hypothetical protein